MRKLIIISLIALITVSCGTEKINKVVKDKKADQKILLGKCDRDGFEKMRFKDWFNSEYLTYTPKDAVLEKLNEVDWKNISVTVVLATWCPDSRREVPRFFKVTDQTNIDISKIKIIAVDRSKQSDALAGVTVDFVPTFIFYKSDIEIGRIIEKPKKSLEQEILDIVAKP